MAIYRASVRLDFAGAGTPGANVWHFRTLEGDLPWDPDSDDQLDNLVEFYQAIAHLYPTTCSIRVPEDVVRIDTTPPESTPFPTVTVQGTATSGEAPEMLAICASWKTSVRTRRGSGRTFLGPVGYSHMATDGTPSNTLTGQVRTACQAFIVKGLALDSSGAFGVYSRLDGVLRDFTGVSIRDGQFSYLSSRRD